MPSVAVTAATVVSWTITVGIIIIGTRFLLAPKTAAEFGIPGTRATDPSFRAWLSVKGVRDIGSGLLLLVVLLGGGTHLTGAMMLVGSVMPLGDALITRLSGGPAKTSYGVHASTAAVMAAAGIVLVLS